MSMVGFREPAYRHVAGANGLDLLQAMPLDDLIEARELVIELQDQPARLHTRRQPRKP